MFTKLTLENGLPIYINPAWVTCVRPDTQAVEGDEEKHMLTGKTMVFFAGEENGTTVKEPISTVMRILRPIDDRHDRDAAAAPGQSALPRP